MTHRGWESNIVEIHSDENGKMTEVVIETKQGERRVEKADYVLMALGSKPASRIVSTTTGIDVDDRGYVVTRETPYGMTTRKGVFAAPKRTAVRAASIAVLPQPITKQRSPLPTTTSLRSRLPSL